jgi:hypothetical protein
MTWRSLLPSCAQSAGAWRCSAIFDCRAVSLNPLANIAAAFFNRWHVTPEGHQGLWWHGQAPLKDQ